MKRIYIVCEGQTEETFVKTILAPTFLSTKELIPLTIPTSPGHKGGALAYNRVKNFLYRMLRKDTNVFVSTFFDLYGLDKNFPDYDCALQQFLLNDTLNILKQSLHRDIVSSAQCRAERFIPYIQPYEFEALLFSDVDSLVGIDIAWQKAAPILHGICQAAKSPEHINNSIATKPAAHLKKHLQTPKYNKVLHGSLAAKKIGLARIEQKCQFFATWLQQLRHL